MVTDLAGQSNSTEVNFTVSRDHSTIGESQMLAIGRASYPDLEGGGGGGGGGGACMGLRLGMCSLSQS